MNAEPGHSVFDRDLDVPQPTRIHREFEWIGEFQRLLANPLLAVVCWLADFFVIRQAVRTENFPLFLGGLGLLFAPILLVQYHCLDCGATGLLFRSRSHACPVVVARLDNPGARRRRGLRLKTQLILWSYGLAAASVLAVVGYLSR